MGRPKEMMIGFQTDVSGLSGKDNWLEMYTGRDIAPGLFAWVIPTGNNTHRIGVWSRPQDLDGRSVEECYDTLISHPLWKERFAKAKEIARTVDLSRVGQFASHSKTELWSSRCCRNGKTNNWWRYWS